MSKASCYQEMLALLKKIVAGWKERVPDGPGDAYPNWREALAVIERAEHNHLPECLRNLPAAERDAALAKEAAAFTRMAARK